MKARAKIYRKAFQNYKEAMPERSAVTNLAAIVNVSEATLYKVLEGDRAFTVQQEEVFFLACAYPQGFISKRDMVFPMMVKS